MNKVGEVVGNWYTEKMRYLSQNPVEIDSIGLTLRKSFLT